MNPRPGFFRALRVRGLCLLAGLSSLLLARPTYPAAPPLPPDPEIVLTFEKETYVPTHQVGPAGSRAFRSPLESHYRTCVAGTSFDKGIAGQCVRFAKAEDAVEVLSTRRLDKATAMTISAWVKLDEIRDLNYVVSKEDWRGGKTRGFALRVLTDGVADFTIGSEGWVPCRAPGIKTGAWHHLVGTCDEKNLGLWISGKRAASVPSKGPIQPSPTSLTIGRSSSDKERGLTGAIDEVAVYNRVLTDAEIMALHRRGRAGELLAKATPLDEPPELSEATAEKGEARKPASKDSKAPGTAGSARPTRLFEAEGIARLFSLGENKLGLLMGAVFSDKKHLEFRAGEGGKDFRFGEPVKIEPPAGKDNLTTFDCVADSKGTVHVFLTEDVVGPEIAESVVHYLQLSREGKTVLPWLSLTSKLELERQPYPPAVFPLRDGKLLFLTTGRAAGKDGLFITAEAASGQLRVLSKQPLPANRFLFSLEGSYGRVVATGPKDVWLVDLGMDRRSWVHLQTGKKTTWFASPDGADSWIDEEDWTVASAGGLLYAAARVGKGNGRGAVPAKLVLARAKAGDPAKLVEIPGKFKGDASTVFVASSKGAMFLLAVTGIETKNGPQDRLELWDVSAAKPAKVATVHEGIMIGEVAAVPGADDTIHVVFRATEEWYGTTLSTRKR